MRKCHGSEHSSRVHNLRGLNVGAPRKGQNELEFFWIKINNVNCITVKSKYDKCNTKNISDSSVLFGGRSIRNIYNKIILIVSEIKRTFHYSYP